MGPVVSKSKKTARFILDTHVWNLSKARVISNDYLQTAKPSRKSNKKHMLGALDWLKRAQDVTGNGGVAGRYLLNKVIC